MFHHPEVIPVSEGQFHYGRAQEELERVLIDCALDQTGGQRQKAAELLGLGRNTLTRKLQKIENQDSEAPVPLDQAAGGT